MTEDRTAFEIDGRVYVSAGVMFYTIDKDNGIHFLLQELPPERTGRRLEDFGGKSNRDDTSIEDVAFRECQEELNFANGIDTPFLKKYLDSDMSYVYRIPENKYVLYLIHLPIEFKTSLDLAAFGKKEIHCDVVRKVRWITYYDMMQGFRSLHPRLKPEEFRNNLPLILCGAF